MADHDQLTAGSWATFVNADKPAQNPAPEQPSAQSSDRTISDMMSCQPSDPSRSNYTVRFFQSGGNEFIHVRDKTYKVEERHRGQTGAWVMQGKSKYGRYQAVFGEPNPRMVYTSNKGTVIDQCWMH